ncbi:MAG TPA: hypothetical protein VHO69_05395 [Phototrophicaceae bacterium]|jgi:hypothetical protein|nr:hypothetical protein [Phototrophicaceae bacterium]
MGRVINPDSTGKQRNQLMRTAAEILRHLSQKGDLDAEAKDMVATLVYCLREIDEGIDSSAAAWEKRDYWMKAEEFRQKWSWAGGLADSLQAMIFSENWNQMPQFMIKLFPYFADIKITKFTRKDTAWRGAYNRLLQEKPPTA